MLMALVMIHPAMMWLYLCCNRQTATNTIDFVYPSDMFNGSIACTRHSTKCPPNVQVDDINDLLLARLPGTQQIFSSNSIPEIDENINNNPDERPPEELAIQVS
ncbi:hypothetical protein GGI25_004241 [Coemansia spiralis]|uniref:ATP-dependent DNA helicase n=1 Tax=Coemansia spiralis TaxID=417178 RepID=A0A9W8G705_9FUNG|nr:hypothetical protein GGI25_004241 [Coemansia spiralis]